MKLRTNYLLLPQSKQSVKDFFLDSKKTSAEINKIISTTGVDNIHVAKKKSFYGFTMSGISQILDLNQDIFKNLEAIITVSQTFDNRIPNISSLIQKKLNLPSSTFCIDFVDGCNGYIKAISISEMLISKGYSKVLIIAGDLNSSITNNAEISTKILFGDGVGLSIFEKSDNPVRSLLFTDGDINGTISCKADNGILSMDGFEVFRFVNSKVVKFVKDYLKNNSKKIENYNLVAMHQASKLVVSNLSLSLGIKNKISSDFNCNNVGNIGAGSINAWLANIENIDDNDEKKILSIGYGSGLSWGLADFTLKLNKNETIYVNY